jgi:hypothetical protein
MASPCRKCGATKTSHAKRGLTRWLLEKLGFKLRVCGGCRRYRIFRHTRSESGSRAEASQAMDQPSVSMQQATEVLRGQTAAGPAAAASAISDTASEPMGSALAPLACPECGSTNYRRSRRTSWERARGIPRMLRCRECRRRFEAPD